MPVDHFRIRGLYVAILWSVDTGDALRHFDIGDTYLRTAEFHPSGERAAIGTVTGEIIIVDVSSGEMIRRLQAFDTLIIDVAYSPDGRLITAGGLASSVRLFDAETGQIIADYVGHPAGIWRIKFSPDGQYLFTGGLDGTVRQWIVPNDTPESVIEWAYGNRYVREFTCEERETYRIEPLCQED